MRAMLTGHRVVSGVCLTSMRQLIRMLPQEDLTIISGGNLGTPVKPSGADRMWALAAFEENVPYEIWVPRGYGENYYRTHPDMMTRFNKMLDNAAAVHYAPDVVPFHWSANFKRNGAMVKTADYYVVCSDEHPRNLLTKTRGGTAHCVKEMKKAGVKSVDWIDATSGEIHRDTYLVDASLF